MFGEFFAHVAARSGVAATREIERRVSVFHAGLDQSTEIGARWAESGEVHFSMAAVL